MARTPILVTYQGTTLGATLAGVARADINPGDGRTGEGPAARFTYATMATMATFGWLDRLDERVGNQLEALVRHHHDGG